MEFEFDENKSRKNKVKHGIDFVEAQAIWDDENILEIPAKTKDEPRNMVIGLIGHKPWSAIITGRNGATRIISARRSTKKEVDLYESF
jgi:uncharacterized DUF497 family protein